MLEKVLIIILIVLVVIIILLYIICAIIYRQNLMRKPPYTLENTNFIKKYPKVLEHDKNIRRRKYEDWFINSFDNLKLHAFYFRCNKETKNTIVFVHGWYGNALSDSAFVNDFLYDDYNVLVLDLRSHGQSEGKYLGFSILDYKDVLKWIDVLIEKDNDVKIALHGISMGAATVMLASAYVKDNVKAIIEDSGFTSAWSELKYVLKK